MSILSAVRNRTGAVLLIWLLVGLALLAVPMVASADPTPSPYPPGQPSSAVSAAAAQRQEPAANTTNRSRTDQTASTGFQALTATAIAGALLVGGTALVLVGRRRRSG